MGFLPKRSKYHIKPKYICGVDPASGDLPVVFLYGRNGNKLHLIRKDVKPLKDAFHKQVEWLSKWYNVK